MILCADGNFDLQLLAGGTGAGYWLVFIGVAVNAAIPPLHTWVADAYPESTPAGTVYMGSFTTKVAIYALIRLFAGTEWLVIVGGLMAVFGACMALIENDLRKLLSYHIVSQLGMMVAGLATGLAVGIDGAALHAAFNILYKGVLLMAAGAVFVATGKKKISELTLSDNLKGLYTIGVKLINGVQTSVKVSLEYIQNVYEDILTAISDANTATANANKATTAANDAANKANTSSSNADRATTAANEATTAATTAAKSANTAAETANTAASNADEARIGLEEMKNAAVTATNKANAAATGANNAAKAANDAAGEAEKQADRAQEHADNPPMMGENGNWWKWDEEAGSYVDTGVLAKGGVLYPSFEIKDDDMCLYMSYQDEIAQDQFDLDEESGCLNFIYK